MSSRDFVVLSAKTRIQRNKRPQEDYGRAAPRFRANKPTAQASCAVTQSLCPGLHLALLFLCSQKGLPLPGVITPGVASQAINVEKDRYLGFQAAGGRGWWGGMETCHLLVPVFWKTTAWPHPSGSWAHWLSLGSRS